MIKDYRISFQVAQAPLPREEMPKNVWRVNVEVTHGDADHTEYTHRDYPYAYVAAKLLRLFIAAYELGYDKRFPELLSCHFSDVFTEEEIEDIEHGLGMDIMDAYSDIVGYDVTDLTGDSYAVPDNIYLTYFDEHGTEFNVTTVINLPNDDNVEKQFINEYMINEIQRSSQEDA